MIILKKAVVVLVALLALVLGLWVQNGLKVDFTTVDGQQHNWSNSAGKWTVVNYFAQWCAPCLREIPELNHFYQQHKDTVAIFAVSFDRLDKNQLSALQHQYAIQFPVIATLNTLPWGQPPNSLPTTYILDADGKVQKQLKGEQSAEKLIQTINLLKAL